MRAVAVTFIFVFTLVVVITTMVFAGSLLTKSVGNRSARDGRGTNIELVVGVGTRQLDVAANVAIVVHNVVTGA